MQFHNSQRVQLTLLSMISWKEIKIGYKKVLRIFYISLIFVLIYILFFQIIWSKTQIVCGTITGESKLRTHRIITYKFYESNRIFEGFMYKVDLRRDISIDSMKRIKCVRICVSEINPNFNYIVDDRFVTE